MKSEMDNFKFRNKKTAERIVKKINEADVEMSFMHVCGTHQDTLVRFGLEQMLNEAGITIRQGPGCPVCVTTPREIEEVLVLAREGITITAYGDMINVPGEKSSLSKARREGAKVKVVYSVDDAVKIAKKIAEPVVFMSVGFETTTPSIASMIKKGAPQNFFILPCHRLVPPALKAIMEMGEIKLDGLIEPGHVSTIIGMEPYIPLSKKYGIPQVIAGFEPLDLLMGIYMLIRQVKEGRADVENEYTRVVRREGNPKALQVMYEVFEPVDIQWRGFPTIPGSGLKIREKYIDHDAREEFKDILEPLKEKDFGERKGCLCGEVLRALKEPEDCPLFGKRCTPKNPMGPCMVSREGGCNIRYRFSPHPVGESA